MPDPAFHGNLRVTSGVGQRTRATFELPPHTIGDAYVRLMCNQHGLWSSTTPFLLADRRGAAG